MMWGLDREAIKLGRCKDLERRHRMEAFIV
jgi:hypothetical protein